jgi:hypothetical protein
VQDTFPGFRSRSKARGAPIREDIMLGHLQYTPRSTWEIIDKGREWLRAHTGTATGAWGSV